MKKIIAIGEALIDFIPQPDGSYLPMLGGAPCNVCGAYTKLSGKAGILGGAILLFIGIEIFVTNLV